ncbi:MAG: tetratricopeptide repeat protein [Myxococcota bacterium]|nr:tetratricopeptide repeat protein [Myxococcota bacterium]
MSDTDLTPASLTTPEDPGENQLSDLGESTTPSEGSERELRVDWENLPPMPDFDESLNPESNSSSSATCEANPGTTEFWNTQIAQYQRELETVKGNEAKATICLEIGRIFEEHIGQRKAAASYYQKAFALDRSNGSVIQAARSLFSEGKKFELVTKLLQAEIETASHPAKRAILLSEKGALLDNELNQKSEAKAEFQNALEVWASEPLAGQYLEQLHLRNDEYSELYSLYTRSLAVAQSKDRIISLHLAAAQLAELHLNQPENAVVHYEALLAAEPGNEIGQAALRRLYGPLKRWSDLVDVLTQSASAASSSGQTETFLVSAARILADKLGEKEKAIAVMLTALQHAPDDIVLLREIEWLYEEIGAFDDTVRVLERQSEVLNDSPEGTLVMFRRAVLLEEKLQNIEAAVELYRQVLQRSPRYEAASQALGRIYHQREDWEALSQLYQFELTHCVDNDSKVVLLFKSAQLYSTKLDNPSEAIERLLELLATNPKHQSAILLLEELYVRNDRVADLIELYRLDARHISDANLKIAKLLQVAELCEMKLSAYSLALETYQEILVFNSEHDRALDGVIRTASHLHEYEQLLPVLDKKLSIVTSGPEWYKLKHLQARSLSHIPGRDDEVIAAHEEILKSNPSDILSLSTLGDLYLRQNRLESVVAMYLREIDGTSSQDYQCTLLLRLGELLASRLGDEERALEVFEKALAKNGNSIAALNALQLLSARLGNYTVLERVLTKEAETTDEPQSKALLLLSIAELCEFQLGRSDRAATILQQVLRLGYASDTAIEGLIRVFSASQDWTALTVALEIALDHADNDASKVAISLRLAEVFSEKLNDFESAIEVLETASKVRPEELSVSTQLQKAYLQTQRWAEYAELSELLYESEEDGPIYTAQQINLSEVYDRHLNDPAKATLALKKALMRSPAHPVPLRALEAVAKRQGDWPSLAGIYHREAMTSTDPRRRSSLLYRAGNVTEFRLNEPETAYDFYQRAVEADPAHLPSVKAFSRLGADFGNAEQSLHALKLEGAATGNVERSLELLEEAAHVYLEKLGDKDKAKDTLNLILERSPGHHFASEKLGEIYFEEEDWSGLITLRRNQALGAEAVSKQIEYLRAAATLASDKLEDVSTAAQIYQEILKRNSSDLDALTRLAPVLLKHKSFSEAKSVLLKITQLSEESGSLTFAYRTLGMIYEEIDQDLVAAVQAYQHACTHDPKDQASLNRLVDLYLSHEDWLSAVHVMELLNQGEQDTTQKASRLLELATLYHRELNDLESARIHLLEARNLAPTNLRISLELLDVLEKQGNWNGFLDTAEAYFRVLPDEQKEESIPLRLKTAQFYLEHLKDEERTLQALKEVLALKPYQLDALELFARIASESQPHYRDAVEAHRRLLRINPFRIVSYHELKRLFEALGESDKVFVVCELLLFLKAEFPEEEQFYAEYSENVAPQTMGSLSPEAQAAIVLHGDERHMTRTLMEIVSPHLLNVFPEHKEQLGLQADDAVKQRQSAVTRDIVDEATEVFGCENINIVSSKEHASAVVGISDNPFSLIVGTGFERRTRETEKRIVLARHVQGLKGGHHIFAKLTPEESAAFVYGLALLAEFAVPEEQQQVAEAWKKRLGEKLPQSVIKQVADLRSRKEEWSSELTAYFAALEHTRNRAAMVLANDTQAMLKTVMKENGKKAIFADADSAETALSSCPQALEMMAFFISDQYFLCREMLGVSILDADT